MPSSSTTNPFGGELSPRSQARLTAATTTTATSSGMAMIPTPHEVDVMGIRGGEAAASSPPPPLEGILASFRDPIAEDECIRDFFDQYDRVVAGLHITLPTASHYHRGGATSPNSGGASSSITTRDGMGTAVSAAVLLQGTPHQYIIQGDGSGSGGNNQQLASSSSSPPPPSSSSCESCVRLRRQLNAVTSLISRLRAETMNASTSSRRFSYLGGGGGDVSGGVGFAMMTEMNSSSTRSSNIYGAYGKQHSNSNNTSNGGGGGGIVVVDGPPLANDDGPASRYLTAHMAMNGNRLGVGTADSADSHHHSRSVTLVPDDAGGESRTSSLSSDSTADGVVSPHALPPILDSSGGSGGHVVNAQHLNNNVSMISTSTSPNTQLTSTSAGVPSLLTSEEDPHQQQHQDSSSFSPPPIQKMRFAVLQDATSHSPPFAPFPSSATTDVVAASSTLLRVAPPDGDHEPSTSFHRSLVPGHSGAGGGTTDVTTDISTSSHFYNKNGMQLQMMDVPHSGRPLRRRRSNDGSIASFRFARPTVITEKVEQTEDDIGTQMLNNYLLMDHLGAGACGSVDLAFCVDRQEPVAIKMVPKPKKAAHRLGRLSEAREAALRQEISVMTKLRHKNIVSLYEVIDDPDAEKMYLVMQYIDRGSIGHVAPDGTCTRIEPHALAEVARQVAAGLDYLHSHGVVHRDVKPENILVNSNHEAFLTDFGAAEEFGALDDAMNGTPLFCGPELVKARANSIAAVSSPPGSTGEREDDGPVSPPAADGSIKSDVGWSNRVTRRNERAFSRGCAADMWAFGVSLYTLCCGHVPFRKVEEIAAYKGHSLRFPKSLGSGWRRLIHALLAVSPDKRPTAFEARGYIKQILQEDEDRLQNPQAMPSQLGGVSPPPPLSRQPQAEEDVEDVTSGSGSGIDVALNMRSLAEPAATGAGASPIVGFGIPLRSPQGSPSPPRASSQEPSAALYRSATAALCKSEGASPSNATAASVMGGRFSNPGGGNTNKRVPLPLEGEPRAVQFAFASVTSPFTSDTPPPTKMTAGGGGSLSPQNRQQGHHQSPVAFSISHNHQGRCLSPPLSSLRLGPLPEHSRTTNSEESNEISLSSLASSGTTTGMLIDTRSPPMVQPPPPQQMFSQHDPVALRGVSERVAVVSPRQWTSTTSASLTPQGHAAMAFRHVVHNGNASYQDEDREEELSPLKKTQTTL